MAPMLFDSLNLNHLRIFQSVYRTKSMTAAAKDLHLTQSGVSQHVSSLEESLGVKLFDRINKKIMATEEGQRFYSEVSTALDSLEVAVSGIANTEVEIEGVVRIGMPIEFGNNIIIPRLSEIAKEYEGIDYKITLDFAGKINDLLLSGDLDFAFVDEYRMDRRVDVEPVAEEFFELCTSQKYFKKMGGGRMTKAYFESLEYISYQEDEPVLRSWFAHHMKRKNLNLNVRAQVMDVQGIRRFIMNDMGVGILPDHLVKRLEKKYPGELKIFKGSGKPLTNKLSLASLKNRSFSSAALLVKEALRERVFPKGYRRKP